MAASCYSSPFMAAALILMISSLATSSSLVCERNGSAEFELWTLESATIELETSVPAAACPRNSSENVLISDSSCPTCFGLPEGLGDYCDVTVSGSFDGNAPAALDGDLNGSYRPVGCHNSQPAYLRTSAPDNEDDDAGEDIMWVFTRVGDVADAPGFVGIMGGDAFWLTGDNTTAAAPVKVALGGNATVEGGQLQIQTMCKASRVNGTEGNRSSLTSLHASHGTLNDLRSMVRSNPERGLGNDLSADKAFVGGVVFACIAVAGIFIALRRAIHSHGAWVPGSSSPMQKPLINGRDSSAV